MSMVKCRECGAEISDKAKSCPKCGIAKPAQKRGVSLWAAIIVIIGVIWVVAAIQNQNAQPAAAEPTPSAADTYRLNQIARGAAALKALRASLRNPDSFKLSQALSMPRDAVCLEYRAQNGFGGLNLERALVHGDSLILESADNFSGAWNRYCGSDKRGPDITDDVTRIFERIQ